MVSILKLTICLLENIHFYLCWMVKGFTLGNKEFYQNPFTPQEFLKLPNKLLLLSSKD